MTAVIAVAGNVLIGLGTVLLLLAAIGIVRLPDVFARLHAAGLGASLGIASVLLGSALLVETAAARVALVVAVVFQFAAGPFATHALSRAAHRSHAPMWAGTVVDELRDAD